MHRFLKSASRVTIGFEIPQDTMLHYAYNFFNKTSYAYKVTALYPGIDPILRSFRTSAYSIYKFVTSKHYALFTSFPMI